MTKPTPGPWRVVHRQNSYQFLVFTDGQEQDVLIAYMPSDNPRIGLANARLIAASPELLEALTELLKTIDLVRDGAMSVKPLGSAMERASAAIRKARGES